MGQRGKTYEVVPVEVGQQIHHTKAPTHDGVELQDGSLVDGRVDGVVRLHVHTPDSWAVDRIVRLGDLV